MSRKNQIIGYLAVSALLLLDLVAALYFKISLAGYWSDRVLFWIWFFYSIYIIIKFWRSKWARRYFYSLLVLVALTMLPMGIIFFGILLSATGEGLLYNKQISDEYSSRLQVIQSCGSR